MDKGATIRPTLHVEGEDKPENRFGDDSISLVREIIEAGVIVVSKRRCAMALPFRKVTLTKIEEVEGSDDSR
jgi:hypothetical protein